MTFRDIQPSTSDSHTPLVPLKILYVDDDKDYLYLARHYLEKSGQFHVDTIPSARDALLHADISSYDAIISDYYMPDLDGIAFLKKIREQYDDIPFILCTIRSREEVLIEAINNHVDFYIQKNKNLESQFVELIHAIKQAVERKQAKKSLLDSEKYISDIIDFLPDATFAIDQSGTVIAWNRAIEEMTGVPARDMLGKGDFEYSIPFYGSRRPLLIDMIDESDDVIDGFYTDVFRKDGSLNAQTSHATPKETRISTLVRVSRLYNKSGDIVGAIESIRDITELKRIEEKLRKSEERFRGMAERSSDLIVVLDNELRAVYVSPSSKNITGYEPSELLGKAVEGAANTVFADCQKDFLRVVAELRKGTALYNIEICLTKKDGSQAYVDMSVVPVIEQEILAGAQVSIRDITERKKTELATQALMVSMVGTTGYTSLRKIVCTIQSWLHADCVLLGEISSDHRDINILSMVLLGSEYSSVRFPLKGTPCEQVISGGFCQYTDDVSLAFPACKELEKYEFRGYLGTPLRNSAGEVIGSLCALFRKPFETSLYVRQILDIIAVKAAADIERSHIEQKLRENQQMLAEAMDLAHLVNWEYDAILDVFTFDDRFYAMYGTTAEREGGNIMSSETYAREFVHPDDMYMVADEIAKAIHTTDLAYTSQLEHRIIRRDGEIRHIQVRFGITKDQEGRTIRTHGANQDITGLKKNEMALKQANRQLNLLSSITRHDILNMVTVLLLYLEGLERECAVPELCEAYAKMTSATKMIQSQIEFTRVYEDIGLHEPKWQKLNDILSRLKIPSRVLFHNSVPDISVFADPMLEKVFYNLLDNSIRHGQRVTEIRVSSYPVDKSMVVVWEDNGVGIPEDEKKEVFERGFGKNTGLGMFLARDILLLTGIEIHETGKYGVGARFEIRVPKGGWRYY